MVCGGREERQRLASLLAGESSSGVSALRSKTQRMPCRRHGRQCSLNRRKHKTMRKDKKGKEKQWRDPTGQCQRRSEMGRETERLCRHWCVHFLSFPCRFFFFFVHDKSCSLFSEFTRPSFVCQSAPERVCLGSACAREGQIQEATCPLMPSAEDRMFWHGVGKVELWPVANGRYSFGRVGGRNRCGGVLTPVPA